MGVPSTNYLLFIHQIYQPYLESNRTTKKKRRNKTAQAGHSRVNPTSNILVVPLTKAVRSFPIDLYLLSIFKSVINAYTILVFLTASD